MDRKIRVLLLVAEPWRTDDGGGNTLDNFFRGMDVELAQIYCSDRLPLNGCCQNYYQMTDGEVIKKFLTHRPIGRVLDATKEPMIQDNVSVSKERKLMQFFSNHRLNCFLLAKQILWRFSNWKTAELESFIIDFSPDVIYAPCYASPFQLVLTRYVKQLTNKHIITWSADDNYSLRQFSFSPSFWIARFWTRNALKKTYPYYSQFLSICGEEIEEMAHVVKIPTGILRKGIDVDVLPTVRQSVNTPIRMIYAGGVYINRWRTLAKIGEALRVINRDGLKMKLDIYTQNALTPEQARQLNDGIGIQTHDAVGADELKELYANSDIALHVESFNLKDRLSTRLSFSTKIVDCLASGCAVMAIAWEQQAGLRYLAREEAAICITNIQEIQPALEKIVANPEVIIQGASQARACVLKNHDIRCNQKMLYDLLEKYSEMN